jgi:hypothetical protein
VQKLSQCQESQHLLLTFLTLQQKAASTEAWSYDSHFRSLKIVSRFKHSKITAIFLVRRFLNTDISDLYTHTHTDKHTHTHTHTHTM